MRGIETKLPDVILARASLRGNEYAWPIADIPDVIAAIKEAGLINMGGQLQFRFPSGSTCECYWIGIDPDASLPGNLSHSEKVTLSAAAALSDFKALKHRFSFLHEGWAAYQQHFQDFESKGGDPEKAMCFVMYAIE